MLAQSTQAQQKAPEWDEFGDDPGSIDAGNNAETGLVPVERAAPLPHLLDESEIPALDEMEEGPSIAPIYWEADVVGDAKRGVFIGWSKMNSKNGGTVDMAVFQNQAGIFTGAGANLIQQLQVIPFGTPLKITYDGTEKTSNNFKVKKFTIKKLLPSRGPVTGGPGISTAATGTPVMERTSIPGVPAGTLPQGDVVSRGRAPNAQPAHGIPADKGDANAALPALHALIEQYRTTYQGKVATPEQAKTFTQYAAAALSKTGIGSDADTRHLFIRAHFEEVMTGSLKELQPVELKALRDWADRTDAKNYITWWMSQQN